MHVEKQYEIAVSPASQLQRCEALAQRKYEISAAILVMVEMDRRIGCGRSADGLVSSLIGPLSRPRIGPFYPVPGAS